MPRYSQNPEPKKKNSIKRNGNMAPTTGINLNGPDLSPRTRYEQEFDDFDLFQTKKPESKQQNSHHKKIAMPGATGNTPVTSQENFNMSNMIKNRPTTKPAAKAL